MSVGGVRKTDFKDKMLCLRPSYRFLPLMCQDQSVLRALGRVRHGWIVRCLIDLERLCRSATDDKHN
ncbi:hypothetical protein DY000_02039405 [Brassica cretica]|uniref:Uncharacterized protein n=1 Tax=Brassica cretica TaxID=69181 RepID=A0ABQ7BRK7_BRACR|nr:hypothetical protein DY000_02039405 [Brassica cretica]